jgi:putative ABC transport system permease protein
MNPFPLVLAEMRRNRAGCAAVIILLAIAVGLVVAVGAQERALRTASARAADRFDLVVGAPGSPTQLVLTTVYLQQAALELVPASVLLALQAEDPADVPAPVAVTDSYRGYPLVGTTAAFATADGIYGPVAGRVFENAGEAMIGAAVALPLGERFRAAHGSAAENVLETREHGEEFVVVGRLAPTGTPWDRAIVVPIEAVWRMHARPASAAGRDAAGGTVARLGPPWSAGEARPVPAIVIRPRTVADAYRLRQQYRGRETMALFPAEALNPLYAVLGDVGLLLRSMAIALDALLMAAIVLVIAAMLAARRDSIGVLRALGAPPRYVFATIWLHGALLVAAGTACGLVVGTALAHVLGGMAGDRLGFAVGAGVGVPELLLVACMFAAGSLLAALPSLAALRAPVRGLLQGN